VRLILFFLLPTLLTAQSAAVVSPPNAAPAERYAVELLKRYLAQLFGIHAGASGDIVFLVGQARKNPGLDANAVKLSDQGILIRTTTWRRKPAIVVSGGSEAATLWAVAELAERWGVRFLAHRDVLPPRRSFRLPQLDITLEPKLRIRQWRVVNEFACGPLSWGLADYRPVIDQLAKMKFNRLLVVLWPHHPFLDYQYAGIHRSSADIFFGYRFPITPDMPGRSLFGNAKQFWNPDLPENAPYRQVTEAGIRHIRSLMQYGRERGMASVINVDPLQFPPEFAPALNSSQPVHQVGTLSIVPGDQTPIDDPKLNGLVGAILQAAVNTYPESAAVSLTMPEHRQWVNEYENAWKSFDARYGIGKDASLSKILDAAAHRKHFHSPPERAVAEVKGDLVNLFFYDRLIRTEKIFQHTKRPDIRVIYDAVAEELYPILGRILHPGDELLNFVDYTPSRIVKRREALAHVPPGENPAVLIYTLHDDNVGLLPQLATGSFHELTHDLRKYGWAGFSTRYWLIGDHDPCLGYLAKAAWDDSATPAAIYRDQFQAVCGSVCVEPMMEAMKKVETATLILEEHGLGFAFPVEGMMMKHWTAQPLNKEILAVQSLYEEALRTIKEAREKTMPDKRLVEDYWIGRLSYGIDYIEAARQLHEAAIADSQGNRPLALEHAEAALAKVKTGIESYARIAVDQSDRGAIAMMGELVYRPLKNKVADLRR